MQLSTRLASYTNGINGIIVGGPANNMALKALIQLCGTTPAPVYALGADAGDVSYEWPVYQCIYAELQQNGVQFLLNGGTWYNVDATFRDRIEHAFSARSATPR